MQKVLKLGTGSIDAQAGGIEAAGKHFSILRAGG
jgi:hypothetical protein